MVRQIKLNNGESIPALGWGNGTSGLGKSGQKAIDIGAAAIKAGIPHIDTAQIYGTEAETHGAIEKSGAKRADIWVTTKIGKKIPTTPSALRENVQESLDKLQTKPNLILVHNPYVPEEGKVAEFWTMLEDLTMNGGPLEGVALGVSNYRPQDLEAVLKVARVKPVVNQLEYHPYVLTHLQPLLDLQAKHNIVTQAFGPLSPLLRHPGGPLKPVLTKIAQRVSKDSGKEVDEAQVLLLWTIQNGVVAITTSTKEENIKKLAEVDTLPDLTKEEVKEIEDVGRGVHFRAYTEHMTQEFPDPKLPDGK